MKRRSSVKKFSQYAKFGIVEDVADDWNRHVDRLNSQPNPPSLSTQIQQGIDNMEKITGKIPAHTPINPPGATTLEVAANLALLGIAATAAISSTALYIRRRQTKKGKVVVERVRKRR